MTSTPRQTAKGNRAPASVEAPGALRPDLFSVRPQSVVVGAYRCNYRLGPEIGLAQVLDHARLEAQLADRLLSSTAAERPALFARTYSRLYAELPWLATTGETERFADWLDVLEPGSRVLEIGSGAGRLANFLAGNGYSCIATDVSEARDATAGQGAAGVIWRATDGGHLTEFEDKASFDHVISDQVVEHLHPDDMVVHLSTARELLVDGGSCVLRTPHQSAGPHDLSRVFGFDEPVFLHLREYSFGDIAALAREAGYAQCHAIVAVPIFGRRRRWVIASDLLCKYNILCERLEAALLTAPRNRRRFRRLSKAILLPSQAWVRLVK